MERQKPSRIRQRSAYQRQATHQSLQAMDHEENCSKLRGSRPSATSIANEMALLEQLGEEEQRDQLTHSSSVTPLTPVSVNMPQKAAHLLHLKRNDPSQEIINDNAFDAYLQNYYLRLYKGRAFRRHPTSPIKKRDLPPDAMRRSNRTAQSKSTPKFGVGDSLQSPPQHEGIVRWLWERERGSAFQGWADVRGKTLPLSASLPRPNSAAPALWDRKKSGGKDDEQQRRPQTAPAARAIPAH
jgi:hypothetical protein